MCNFIYLGAIGVILVYCDHVLGQYSLAVSAAETSPMVVAMGWEMVEFLWPLILLGMLLGSALTLLATRRGRRCTSASCS